MSVGLSWLLAVLAPSLLRAQEGGGDDPDPRQEIQVCDEECTPGACKECGEAGCEDGGCCDGNCTHPCCELDEEDYDGDDSFPQMWRTRASPGRNGIPPKVAPGDRITLRFEGDDADNADKDDGDGPYEIVFKVIGKDASFHETRGVYEHKVGEIVSGNVYLYISPNWTSNTIQVEVTLFDNTKNLARQDTPISHTYTFVRNNDPAPEYLVKTDGPNAGVFVPMPYRFYYKGMPLNPPAYEHQIIDETLKDVQPINLKMEYLTDKWKQRHPDITTVEQAAVELWGKSNNTTFTFDAKNTILDRHDGFASRSAFKPGVLARHEVGYKKIQEYRAKGGRAIAICEVTRQYKDGVPKVSKTLPIQPAP